MSNVPNFPRFVLYPTTTDASFQAASKASNEAATRIRVGSKALAAIDAIMMAKPVDEASLLASVFSSLPEKQENLRQYAQDPLGVRNWALMLGPKDIEWSKASLDHLVRARIAAAYGLKEEGLALFMERVRVRKDKEPALYSFVVTFLDRAESAAKKTPERIALLQEKLKNSSESAKR